MMKKPLLFLLIGISCLLLTFFLSGNSQAQVVNLKSPLATDTIAGIIAGIVNFLFKIGIVLAPLLIIMGGFLFITAGGNAEQVNRAKKIILWTIIGFLIVLFAQGIIQVIEDLLGTTSTPASTGDPDIGDPDTGDPGSPDPDPPPPGPPRAPGR